jgi:hypothetical protein
MNRHGFVPEMDALDLRVSPSALIGHAAVSAQIGDDPLPDPEPSPGEPPDPDAPPSHPELPPSGPVGPGTS